MIHALIIGSTTQAKVKVGREMRVVRLRSANLNRITRVKVCEVGGAVGAYRWAFNRGAH
jgi:hypothetical protein